MAGVTRLLDKVLGVCTLGIPHCCPHEPVSGINLTCRKMVLVNGLPPHSVTDSGMYFCPHKGKYFSTQGSVTTRVNGLPITRIGDEVTCGKCGGIGVHTTGSHNVMCFA